MPRPAETSVPQLAAGCRLNASRDMLLVPEGALRLYGSARQIVEFCDGQHNFREIVSALQQRFAGDGARIEQDTAAFLERLYDRRVVNF